jgi:hypothetical protein
MHADVRMHFADCRMIAVTVMPQHIERRSDADVAAPRKSTVGASLSLARAELGHNLLDAKRVRPMNTFLQ